MEPGNGSEHVELLPKQMKPGLVKSGLCSFYNETSGGLSDSEPECSMNDKVESYRAHHVYDINCGFGFCHE